jgi:hypothetical protein
MITSFYIFDYNFLTQNTNFRQKSLQDEYTIV